MPPIAGVCEPMAGVWLPGLYDGVATPISGVRAGCDRERDADDDEKRWSRIGWRICCCPCPGWRCRTCVPGI